MILNPVPLERLKRLEHMGGLKQVLFDLSLVIHYSRAASCA